MLVLVALALPGCSSSGSSSESSFDRAASSGATEISDQAETTPALTAAPDPTGVPGIGVDDPFCSAWAEYVGTLQALGVAASFGELAGQQFAALELAAAPRLVEVAASIDAAWPSELDDERTIVIDQRIGPYARRASRAVESLRGEGVTDGDLATLSSDWQQALSARDPEVAVIERPLLAAELQAKVDAGAVAYDSAVTPFAQDPSLVVDGVETPATDAYLVAHCPDLASSGVGDAL